MSVRLPSTIPGVFEIRSDSFTDSRGKFFNLFRRNDVLYEQVWSERSISQVNLSLTKEAGCIRGLHLQSEPYSECKLVRCLRGRIWDVAVDLRTDSCTFGQWHAVESCVPILGTHCLFPKVVRMVSKSWNLIANSCICILVRGFLLQKRVSVLTIPNFLLVGLLIPRV